MDVTKFDVAIRYLPTGRTHLVFAAGGPRDGSLYGFSTLCGRRIVAMNRWREEPVRDADHICASCTETLWRETSEPEPLGHDKN